MKKHKRFLLLGLIITALFFMVGVPIIETYKLPNQIILTQDEYINGTKFSSNPFVKFDSNYTQDVGLDAQEKYVEARLFGIFKVAKKPVKLLPLEQVLAGGFAIGFEAEVSKPIVLENGFEKQTSSGIGTLTFVNEQNNNFVALGHNVTDYDTGKTVAVRGGSVYKCNVMGVTKSSGKRIGKINGFIDTSDGSEGELHGSNIGGIYGCLRAGSDILQKCKEKYPVASRFSIKPGKAKLLTSIDGETPTEYDIQIVKTFSQSKPGAKSFLIRVVDKRLLENTGGIVHGMSGSPIIQNGKIVGALTHVLLKDPGIGYGIYIDWMFK